MADSKDQKLLYPITDVEHLPTILERGLLPRSELNEFNDVADPEIINARRALGLQDYVPDAALEVSVQHLVNASKFSLYVDINEGMFVRNRE